jgi:hypothetical protein
MTTTTETTAVAVTTCRETKTAPTELTPTARFIAMIERLAPRLLVIDVLPALAAGPTMGTA